MILPMFRGRGNKPTDSHDGRANSALFSRFPPGYIEPDLKRRVEDSLLVLFVHETDRLRCTAAAPSHLARVEQPPFFKSQAYTAQIHQNIMIHFRFFILVRGGLSISSDMSELQRKQ